MERKDETGLRKLPTGVLGFDLIANGGIPEGRITFVAGTAGSGKTILALQYLIAGERQFGEPGVFVTFEEDPHEIAVNVSSLGWNLEGMIRENRIAVVDASPEPGQEMIETGSFDLTALLVRIEDAVRKVDAKRVVLDSVSAIFPQFSDPQPIRRELHRVARGLRRLGVTTLLTMERTEDHGPLSRFGAEEFVADNVVILRNHLENEKRRRTIEVLKFRGATHQKGEYPFTIDPEGGMTVVPLSGLELTQRISNVRVSSGNLELDEMCKGGLFRDSITLVSGATGTGKTLMATYFLKAAIHASERVLLFAFEESREQHFRNAASLNVDYEKAEKDGLLRVICRYPEARALEDHLVHMKREIDEFDPQRVAVDSISALEGVSSPKSFRDFIIGLTSHIKSKQIAVMLTHTSSMIGGPSFTETQYSTMTDSIILLRYVEIRGDLRRGIAMLKMRGSMHEKAIREYVIDDKGMHIKAPFREVSGILSGQPIYSLAGERAQLGGMFRR